MSFLCVCVRLRSFYQTEWDKVHQTYQDEADKYRMLMEQQVRAHTHSHTLVTQLLINEIAEIYDCCHGYASDAV